VIEGGKKMSVEDLQKELVGRMADPVVQIVERGAIARFAEAVGDPNPLYNDVEYAGNSRYGSIIAPPGFFGWPAKPDATSNQMFMDIMNGAAREGFPLLLDAGVDYELFIPICAGDTLVCSNQISGITLRAGKSGNMLLISVTATYRNQNGKIVALATQNIIFR